MAAGKFKNLCLKTLDDVATTKTPVVITKRGRPVAKLMPYLKPSTRRSLAGSVLKESGDPFGTGELGCRRFLIRIPTSVPSGKVDRRLTRMSLAHGSRSAVHRFVPRENVIGRIV